MKKLRISIFLKLRIRGKSLNSRSAEENKKKFEDMLRLYDFYGFKPLSETLVKIEEDLLESKTKNDNNSEDEFVAEAAPKKNKFDLTKYWDNFLSKKRGR